MKCLDNTLKYIEYTSRIFHHRFKEHIRAIRNNNRNSRYSSHILNTRHTSGTITDIIDITRTYKKRKILETH
jgi:hypothetical protein